MSKGDSLTLVDLDRALARLREHNKPAVAITCKECGAEFVPPPSLSICPFCFTNWMAETSERLIRSGQRTPCTSS